MNDEKYMTDKEQDYENMQQSAKCDWTYFNFGDADDHGWTQTEIEVYENWLMSDDPGIHGDGSYYD
ncbi:hypothetical protein DN440_06560 [Lactobacillus reuteri]|uniref:hypothetical protein n=1 Tax=Limosilactobacillus reuteri TaxID=1598 RepID=UPI00128B590D|nr:hypothetical protein [Limosilactobacillus reuteri]MQB95452.1 hypothetical protein [Limosilactobacillus reuteri]